MSDSGSPAAPLGKLRWGLYNLNAVDL
jgi:hypothetical protein